MCSDNKKIKSIAALWGAAAVAFCCLLCFMPAMADGIQYFYDQSNRLIKTITTKNDQSIVVEYTYDEAGNRSEVVTSGNGIPSAISLVAAEFGRSGCIACAFDTDGDQDVDGRDLWQMFH